MKNSKSIVRICNIVSVVLLLVLIGLQFLPYWYGSSNEYWTPEEYAAMTDAEIEEAVANSKKGVFSISLADSCWFPVHEELTFITHAVILLLGAVCIFFCVKNWNSTFTCVPILATAIISLVGYLKPIMTVGNLWIVHLLTIIVLMIPGLVLFGFQIKKWVDWFTKTDVIKT